MRTMRVRGVVVSLAMVSFVTATGCLQRTSSSDGHTGCRSDSDCDTGHACVQGSCAKRGCSSNDECAAGLMCDSAGRCVAPPRECATNSECASPRVCADGRCVELGPGDCEVDGSTLAFGTLAVGVSALKALTILNHSRTPFFVSIGEIDVGSDPAGPVFRYGSDTGAGDYLVPAAGPDSTAGSLAIPFMFVPNRVGEFLGIVPVLRPCAGGVSLHGYAVEHTLECAPALAGTTAEGCGLDFGFVDLNAKPVRQVTFTNHGSQALQLTLHSLVRRPGDAGLFAIEGGEAQSFTIPPFEGSVSVGLSFSPADEGPQAATLSYTTDDLDRPSGVVALSGIGGGPAIDVQSTTIGFDKVLVDTYQYRDLTVANLGSDVGGTTEDNLVFAQLQAGVWSAMPPVVTGPDGAEFSVVWPPTSYPTAGLAAGEQVAVQVKFAPRSAGAKQAWLEIYSNDAVRPTVAIPLSGEGLVQAPCDFEIKPPVLDFGLVDTYRPLTLSFSIVNRATDPANLCWISMLDVTRATREAGVFTLVAGPQGVDAAVPIPAGSALSVPVRIALQPQGTYSGEVNFYVSNPTNPVATVSLSGRFGTSNVMIAPRDLDFGTTGVNCNSRARSFTVYNTGASNQIITAIALQPAATSEFTITQTPPLPSTVQGGASVNFVVTYQPVDVGDDAGAVVVSVRGFPSPVVVPLQGRGATDPVQTETLSGNTKVDVIFIIDDSSSMTDKQASLSRNYSSFMRSAVSNQIDYHIATTTISVDDPSYPCGRFVPISPSSTNPRVITPSTPNKEQVFNAQMMQGTGGTGTESLIRPAYLALLPTLLSGHNAGFYRDDARLEVFLMTDAADQDPLATPVSFYENFFFNLKGLRRRNEFSFSGIIPLKPTAPDYSSGCSYDDPAAGLDPRAKMIIRNSGGVVQEVCDPDWSISVGLIGDHIFGPHQSLFLANTPDMTVTPDPITVTIDGLPFPQLNARGGRQWTYDSNLNAIQIDRNALPAMGSTIGISYHTACL